MLSLSIMTTRMSVADKSRGLIHCQPSKTPRRMRSPAANVRMMAASVIASHVAATRRSGHLRSDANFEAIIGADHVERWAFARQLLVADALLVHALDGFIVIGRLVVEQGQDLSLGL